MKRSTDIARWLKPLAGTALIACAAFPAAAQERFPTRPIEFIVPWGPGGGADQLGRRLASGLEKHLKVSLPVINVPGATGQTGLNKMLTQPNDGYSISIFIADTTAEAQKRVRNNSLGRNYEYIGRLFDKGLGRRIYKRDLDMPDSECQLDYLMTEQIIAGDVDEVLRRLLGLIEETGPFGTLVLMSYDWDDKAAWLHSLELFAKELMPRLNKAVCG